MKKLFAPILFSLLLLAPFQALAASCAELASAAAADMGGEVVAVKAGESNCNVKIRIPGKNGTPPRIESLTLAK